MSTSIKVFITIVIILDVLITKFFLKDESIEKTKRVLAINKFILILTKLIAIIALIKLWLFTTD